MSTIAPTTLPTGTWQLDAVHSQVGFAVDYAGGTFRGSFSPVEASLEVAPDGAASLRGATRVDGIRVQDENLGAHLQSPEFFDAERTPDLRFASTSVSAGDGELRVAGQLTIKGISLPVELIGSVGEPFVDPFGQQRVGLTLSTTIDRTLFGLTWQNPLPNGEPSLADDVVLTAELYLVKA